MYSASGRVTHVLIAALICEFFSPFTVGFWRWLCWYYTADLEDAVAAHDVRLHAYADDTQLYLKCQAQPRRRRRRLLIHLRRASLMSLPGWIWTGSSWMPIKQSFFGLDPNTVLPYLAAVDRHSSLEQRPSKPVTMCVCLESLFLRISA